MLFIVANLFSLPVNALFVWYLQKPEIKAVFARPTNVEPALSK
jgi:hypothetical protein